MKLPRSSEDPFTYANTHVLPKFQFTAGCSTIQYMILDHNTKQQVAKFATINTSKRLLAIKFSMRRGSQPYTAAFKWPGHVMSSKAQELRDALPEIKSSPPWTVL